ncbi:MAG: ABC transporter [Cyanobacteria bacterium CRU_2_1]|nr:ABC transporter [Cyanobacteria bacterium RU_5_0]NJR57701.1 ABC transporter [Cyanobacteria bacterium CRU_2_1]
MKKLHPFTWNSLKLLFWLSPVLIIMGLTAGLIAGWQGVPIALILAGIVLLVFWLITEGSTHPGFWGRRSTQASTNALIATVAVLVILGMINFLAVRYAGRFDLTENQVFTLAPQSQLVVQELKQPIKILIFAPTPVPQDKALLDNYQRLNSQFSYEYIDPQAKPGIASDFGVQSPGEVYVQSGETRRYIQTVSLAEGNDPLAPQERLSERQLTNALVQLTTTRQHKVYLLQGHGERPLTPGQGSFSQVLTSLQEEGLTAEPLNLAADPQVPEDAGILVIAGPQRSLLQTEVDALRSFQARKSGLLMLIDPQTDPNNPQTDPGLNSLLSDWGVKLSDRIIVDPAGQASGLGAGVTIVDQYGNHPITQGFNNGYSIYPLARPLETTVVTDVEAVPLLITSDRTEAHRLAESGELEFDPNRDPRGPFNLGMALSKTIDESEELQTPEASPDVSPSPDAESPDPAEANSQARLVVIGNSSFAADGLFGQQLNGDVLLNSISWLSQQDDLVLSIRPREMTNRRILISPGQQRFVVGLSLVFLPLLGFVTAGFVWWRKR